MLVGWSQNNDDAKVILANAVQHVGQSVKIWLAAKDLEHDEKAKRRVLRKGPPLLSPFPPIYLTLIT